MLIKFSTSATLSNNDLYLFTSHTQNEISHTVGPLSSLSIFHSLTSILFQEQIMQYIRA